MATTLYLGAFSVAGLPAPTTAQLTWGTANAFTPQSLTLTQQSGTEITAFLSRNTGTNLEIVCISPRLNAGAISGSLSSFGAAVTGFATTTVNAALGLYIWKYDNSGVRGVLLPTTSVTAASNTTSSEQTLWSNTGWSLTSQTAQLGDTLVLEIGDNWSSAPTSGGGFYYRGQTAITANGVATSDPLSFITLSQTLSFYADPYPSGYHAAGFPNPVYRMGDDQPRPSRRRPSGIHIPRAPLGPHPVRYR
jgi:hypothetical protein